MKSKASVAPKHAHRFRHVKFGALLITAFISTLAGVLLSFLGQYLLLGESTGLVFFKVSSSSETIKPTPSIASIAPSSKNSKTTDVSGIPATAPGKTLSLGQQAIVEIDTGFEKSSLVQVSLVSIEKASPSQHFTLRKSLPQLEGMTVYFSKYSLVKVGGSELSGFDVYGLFSTLSSQSVEIPRLKISDWKDCGSSILPPEVDKANYPVTICLASAAPVNGLKPVAAQFSQPFGIYNKDNSGQIIWFIE